MFKMASYLSWLAPLGFFISLMAISALLNKQGKAVLVVFAPIMSAVVLTAALTAWILTTRALQVFSFPLAALVAFNTVGPWLVTGFLVYLAVDGTWPDLKARLNAQR